MFQPNHARAASDSVFLRTQHPLSTQWLGTRETDADLFGFPLGLCGGEPVCDGAIAHFVVIEFTRQGPSIVKRPRVSHPSMAPRGPKLSKGAGRSTLVPGRMQPLEIQSRKDLRGEGRRDEGAPLAACNQIAAVSRKPQACEGLSSAPPPASPVKLADAFCQVRGFRSSRRRARWALGSPKCLSGRERAPFPGAWPWQLAPGHP